MFFEVSPTRNNSRVIYARCFIAPSPLCRLGGGWFDKAPGFFIEPPSGVPTIKSRVQKYASEEVMKGENFFNGGFLFLSFLLSSRLVSSFLSFSKAD